MSKKSKLILAASIAVILCIVGIVLFIVYPPAGVLTGVIAAAMVTWCVTRAFDTIADHVAETLPDENHVLDPSTHHEGHLHTHTLIMSRDTIDEQGRHVTETITDITHDDEEPRPTKHKLVS